MAAVLLQGPLQFAKQPAVAAPALLALQHAAFSSEVHKIKKPSLSAMRRGGGGRSSFNGVVATVFGASGLLGRGVCSELGRHGSQVIIPYRGDFYDVQDLKVIGDLGQVLFHSYDIRNEDSIRRAVKYSNVVVNLVGRDWETKNFKFDDVHVHGARRLARIAREEGVERFIHLSALNCSPNPEPHILWKGSGILRSKYYGELAVREEFPDATIIRPSAVFGINDRFIEVNGHFLRSIFRHFPIWKKGLETTKMPVFKHDIARAVYAIIKDPSTAGQIYQAVGQRRYLLKDLLEWQLKELRRYLDEYDVTDIRFSPFFLARVLLCERLPGRPIACLHREIFERDSITDVLDLDLPTLRDLNIVPELLEDHITHILKPHRRANFYLESVADVEKVAPPQPIVGY